MSTPNPFAKRELTAEELLGGINRELPYSDEAEKGVLSAVLNDPEHMPRAQSMLAPDAFYHHGNRLIWQHLLERHAGNQPLDPVLITTALREQGKLEEVGGAAGIAELFTFVPSATNFEHYAKVVQENYLRRETIRILAQGIDSAQRLGEASRTDAAVVEMIGAVESRVFSLVERAQTLGESKEGALPVSAGVADWVDYMERVQASRGKVLGLSTGILELDSNLHGIDDAEGEIVLLAGRPGMGKTALAGSIVNHLALHEGAPGLVFSIEMSSNQFYSRLILGGAGVDTSKIQTGHFSRSDKDAIAMQLRKLQKSPLYVCASAAVSTADLRAQVQYWKRKAGIRWIMVDHLHLVRSSDPRNNGDERLKLVETMETLQFLKKQHKLGVFVMVQMDRGKDRELGRAPVLADLAGSGAIEWYADHAIFIQRPSYYIPWAKLPENQQEGWKELIAPRRRRNPDQWSDGCKYTDEDGWARQDYEEDAILYIRKNRRGPTPEVHVRYEAEFTRFSSRMPKLNSDNVLDHQIGTWTARTSGAPQAKPASKGARSVPSMEEVFTNE